MQSSTHHDACRRFPIRYFTSLSGTSNRDNVWKEEKDIFRIVKVTKNHARILEEGISLGVHPSTPKHPLYSRPLGACQRSNPLSHLKLGPKDSFLDKLKSINVTLNTEERRGTYQGRKEGKILNSITSRERHNKPSECDAVLKIMDVDRVPIELLHRLFLSQLVRW